MTILTVWHIKKYKKLTHFSRSLIKMTDLSKLFKTTVKAVKLNLNIKIDLNEDLLGIKSKKKSSNNLNVSKEAQNLVKNLTALKENLIKNKSNYVQPK